MATDPLSRLLEFHESRSERAQRVDEARKAPITNDPDEWMAAPDEYDYPGVDTPSARRDRLVDQFNEGDIGLSELGDEW